MMFRRNSQSDDPDLLEARRRLQAQMLGGGSGSGDLNAAGGGAGSVGAGSGNQQLQRQLWEQQILQDARAAAGLGAQQQQLPQNQQQQPQQNQQLQQLQQNQQQLQQQLNSLQGGSPGAAASLQMGQQQQQQLGQQQQQLNQQLLQQQQLNQQLQQQGGEAGRRTSLGEQSQRLAMQRAQLQHAQAQAQAEARMKALLGHEAQVQDQMRLLRQRQLASPSSQTAFSASALEMLGGTSAQLPQLGGGGGGEAGANQASLAARFKASNQGNMNVNNMNSLNAMNHPHRASLLGLQQGANPNSNMAQQQQQPTNNVLPANRLGEEAMVFGKISRENTDQAAVADVALLHQRSSDDSGKGKHSRVPEKEEDSEEELDDEAYFKEKAGEPGADGGYPIAREAFPIKLYRILYEAEQNKQDDIISFFPHGRAFAVHKSKEFTRDIMPKYFPAGRMNTFLKQLNLYGFRRITEGRDKGGYFHKDFLNGKRHLCKKIKRKKVHVNKTPPPAAMQAMQGHHHLQQSALQPQIPFRPMESLGGLGNAQHGGLSHHQQLLQQQQQQMASLGLHHQSAASSANAAFFPSNNHALLNASSDLTQAYIQDLQSPATGSRLHPSNFTNLNLNSFNNPNNNPNLR